MVIFGAAIPTISFKIEGILDLDLVSYRIIKASLKYNSPGKRSFILLSYFCRFLFYSKLIKSKLTVSPASSRKYFFCKIAELM